MAKKKLTNTNTLKRAMIEALEKSLGIVTTACKSVGISRTTHYEWLKTDEEYKAAVNSIEDIAIDFSESQLLQLIKNGDTTATIFHLKTKGRKRGYNERDELQVRHSTDNVTLKIDLGKMAIDEKSQK